MFQQTPTWARIPRTSDRISGENKKWRDSSMRDYTERHKNILRHLWRDRDISTLGIKDYQ